MTSSTGVSGSSSPRTRGCFCRSSAMHRRIIVFPAHPGVFLSADRFAESCCRLPRAPGGVSLWQQLATDALASSPRTRGCFYRSQSKPGAVIVFPAHPGVFPCDPAFDFLTDCLPRAHGGVSAENKRWLVRNDVFPAHAGGVSIFRVYRRSYRPSSPRTRGGFYAVLLRHFIEEVFPAHAGVFLPPRW